MYWLKRSKKLREAGKVLGREGLAKMALELAKELTEEGGYKEAIICAGKMSALVLACGFDPLYGRVYECLLSVLKLKEGFHSRECSKEYCPIFKEKTNESRNRVDTPKRKQ